MVNPRKIANTLIPVFDFDKSSDTPMYVQIFAELRKLILTGQLRRGERLPSSRGLARELQVSRNTVVAAFDQLATEGYLQSRLGGGSYVASVVPDEMMSTHLVVGKLAKSDVQVRISHRVKSLM